MIKLSLPKHINPTQQKVQSLETAYNDYWRVEQAWRAHGPSMTFEQASRILNKVLQNRHLKNAFRKKVEALKKELVLGKLPKRKALKLPEAAARVVSLRSN